MKNYLLAWNKFPRLSLLAVTLPLLLITGWHQSLMAYDEGYYANEARWIWESGDWLTPQWWGTPIYDRTIGIQWLIALAYHLFGLSEFSARLPSRIAGILSILLTYEIGKILFDRQIAWLGALMLMFMPLWVIEVHLATQNAVLVTVELWGIWAILQLTERNQIGLPCSDPQIWGWGLIAGMSVGLGFIVKGFMIFVPIVAILPYIISQQRYRQLAINPGIYLGLIVGLLPTILWLFLSYQKYGMMPIRDLLNKVLFLSKADIYNPSPFYYLWTLPLNIFPWALFSAIGAAIVWQKLLPNLNYSAISMTLGYPIALFILLSLFQTRMAYYTLQLLPLMSLLAATAFVKFTQINRHRSPQWYRSVAWLSYAFSGLGIVLAIAGIMVLSSHTIGGIVVPSEIQIYALPALILGSGWTSIGCLWQRCHDPSAPSYWLAGWLIPAWLTIVSFGLQGAWTDKSPDFIAAIHQPQIQSAIAIRPVNLLIETMEDSSAVPATQQQTRAKSLETAIEIVEDNRRGNQDRQRYLDNRDLKTLILLTFYTPHLGKKIGSVSDLPPQAYAWTLTRSPQLATQIRAIAKIDNWQLVQKIS